MRKNRQTDERRKCIVKVASTKNNSPTLIHEIHRRRVNHRLLILIYYCRGIGGRSRCTDGRAEL